MGWLSWYIAIRKIWPSPVNDLPSRDSRTHPVPSIAAWVVGSANTPNTASAAAGIVIVAVMVSLVMPYRLRPTGEVIANTANYPCVAQEEKVMSLSVSAAPDAVATLES